MLVGCLITTFIQEQEQVDEDDDYYCDAALHFISLGKLHYHFTSRKGLNFVTELELIFTVDRPLSS